MASTSESVNPWPILEYRSAFSLGRDTGGRKQPSMADYSRANAGRAATQSALDAAALTQQNPSGQNDVAY